MKFWSLLAFRLRAPVQRGERDLSPTRWGGGWLLLRLGLALGLALAGRGMEAAEIAANSGSSSLPLPVVSAPPGTYEESVLVSLSAPYDLIVTLDGSEPRPGGMRYDQPWIFQESVTLKYRGYVAGVPVSPTMESRYEIHPAEIPPPPPGGTLRAHWRFDAGSGNFAADETGWFGASLSSEGADFVPDGVAGGALRLQRRSRGLAIAGFWVGFGPIYSGSPSTVSAWVKVAPEADANDAWVLSVGTIGLRLGVDGYSVLGEDGPGLLAYPPQRAGSDRLIRDGNWHHLLVTFLGTGRGDVRLFVDGEAQSRSLTGPRVNSGLTVIGGHYDLWGNLQGSFDGMIDDVQLYDFAVPPDLVHYLYTHPGQPLAVPRADPPQPPSVDSFAPTNRFTRLAEYVHLYSRPKGGGVLQYQWFFNDQPIPGQTRDGLDVGWMTPDKIGSYRLEVTNFVGKAVSETITYRYLPLAVEWGPFDQNLAVGEPLLLKCGEVGAPPFTYQWYREGVPLPGATGPTYAVAAVQLSDFGGYHVVVGNPDGTVQSRIAQVTVAGVPPKVLTGLRWVYAAPGEGVRFELHTSGAQPMRYVWYNAGDVVPGQTNATLVLSEVGLADTGSYWARVSNDYGVAESPNQELRITSGLLPGYGTESVTITPPGGGFLGGSVQIKLQTSIPGAEIRYTTDGSEPLPDSPIFSAPIPLDHSAEVKAAAFSEGARVGQVAGAQFLFRPVGSPRLVLQPQAQTVLAGTTARLVARAESPVDVTYDWYFNSALTPFAQGPELVLPDITFARAGIYHVIARNRFGWVVSEYVWLKVDPRPTPPPDNPGLPKITLQPRSTEVMLGQPTSLSVVASGGQPLAYRWTHDGTTLPSATSSVLSIPRASYADAGLYQVIIENFAGVVTSLAARITVTDPVPLEAPVIVTQPADLTVEAGALARFQVEARGSAPLSYAWYRVDTSGFLGLGNSLELVAQPENAGEVYVRIANEAGVIESRRARLQVTVPPPAPPPPVGGTVYFINRIPGFLEARIFDVDGTTPLDGAGGYVADLVAGPTQDTLEPVESRTPFRTGPAAGYLQGRLVYLAKITPGDSAWARVRVWKGDGQRTFEQAEADGEPRGLSPIFRVKTGGRGQPPSLPANLDALVSFQLLSPTGAAPELLEWAAPETIAAGASASLSVTVRSEEPIRYQWFQGEPGDLSSPVGSDGPSWEISELWDSSVFWVRVSNPWGSLDSPPIRVAVERHAQQLVGGPEALRVSFGVPALVIPVTASSGLPVSLAVLDGPGIILADQTFLVQGAGDVRVQATQAGDRRFRAADPVEWTFRVDRRDVKISLEGLRQPADGQPRQVTPRTDPPGLPVRVTYDGTPEPPVAPGRYEVVALIEDANNIGRASGILEVVEPTKDISVRVYDDLDGDGFAHATEPGVPGVSVRLRGSGLDILQVTGVDGQTTFGNITAGPFEVEMLTPSGRVPSTPPYRWLHAFAGLGSVAAEFGTQPAGVVSGSVFVDEDGDGLEDPGEVGLAGVTVTLHQGERHRTAVTGPTGAYRFTDVRSGLATVEESDPEGFGSTTPNQRAVLVSAQAAGIAAFGDAPRRAIRGRVFEDINGNLLSDATESGLAGVTVRLRLAGRVGVIAAAITGSRGEYAFLNVPLGSYVVEEVLPTNQVSRASATAIHGPSPQGTRSPENGGTSAAKVEQQSVEVDAEVPKAANFGNHRAGVVTGSVFEDLDDDGAPGLGELGLGLHGARVQFENLDTGARLGSVITSPEGSYRKEGLPPGRYRITLLEVGSAAGVVGRFEAVLGFDGVGAAVVNFGVRAQGSFGGHVFDDANGSRVREISEPGIGGVRVALSRPGQVDLVAVTAGDGSYRFTGVGSGLASLAVRVPAGLALTTSTMELRDFELLGSTPASIGLRAVAIAEAEAFGRWARDAGLADAEGELGDDPDGDGLPNLAEFVLGTSPLVGKSADHPRFEVVRSRGGPIASFLLRKNPPASAGRFYLEQSDDLQEWREIQAVVTVVSGEAGADFIRLLDPAPKPEGRPRFLRLTFSLTASQSR